MRDAERDPIMAELREIRAKMAARFGNDPGTIIEYVEEKWKASNRSGGGQPPGSSDTSTTDEVSEDPPES